MIKHLFLCFGWTTLLIVSGTACAAVVVTGAGSTAFEPVYVKWGNDYEKRTGIKVNYNAVGSNNGVKLIQDSAVDFGATDMPMTQKELVKNGLIQFPTLIEGVVPVINLRGIAKGQLKLSHRVLADIFLGKISKWNDAQIAADNQGVKLPNQQIKAVYRADNSVTTFLFTTYLSQVSADWKSTMGAGKSVTWKTGTGVNGSEEVTAYVKNVTGSIGYVSYGFALQGGLNYAQLQTHDGNFIKPSMDTFKAASLSFEAAKCFCEPMIDKPGRDTWPIASASYILINKSAGSKNVINFFDWAFSNGDQIAVGLGYALLPENVNKLMLDFVRNQVGK